MLFQVVYCQFIEVYRLGSDVSQARIEPPPRSDEKCLRFLAPDNSVVPFLKLASAGALRLFRNRLAFALRGLPDNLIRKTKFVPPHVDGFRFAAHLVLRSIEAHCFSPFSFGGLPPFLAHFERVLLPYFAARALPPLRPMLARYSRIILSFPFFIT